MAYRSPRINEPVVHLLLDGTLTLKGPGAPAPQGRHTCRRGSGCQTIQNLHQTDRPGGPADAPLLAGSPLQAVAGIHVDGPANPRDEVGGFGAKLLRVPERAPPHPADEPTPADAVTGARSPSTSARPKSTPTSQVFSSGRFVARSSLCLSLLLSPRTVSRWTSGNPTDDEKRSPLLWYLSHPQPKAAGRLMRLCRPPTARQHQRERRGPARAVPRVNIGPWHAVGVKAR